LLRINLRTIGEQDFTTQYGTGLGPVANAPNVAN
jgi:hypothetical protein